jgi:hypothetical protein
VWEIKRELKSKVAKGTVAVKVQKCTQEKKNKQIVYSNAKDEEENNPDCM